MTRIFIYLFSCLNLLCISANGQRDSRLEQLANDFLIDSLVPGIRDLTINSNYDKLDHDFYKNEKGQLFIRTLSIGIDSGYIVYREVPKIDIKTFEYLGIYWKDKNSVYCCIPTSCGESVFILEEADIASFKVQETDKWWGMDKYSIFCRGIKLKDLNSNWTLLKNSEGYFSYVKDSSYVYYYERLIKGADAKSFRIVENPEYDALDNFRKYKNGQPIN